MAYSHNYHGLIFTHHALERLKDRNIPQHVIYTAWKNPEKTSRGNGKGTHEFYKKVDGRQITVIASQNEKREWVVLSCWVNPPYTGSIDIAKKKAYLTYKHGSFGYKLWVNIKKALGFSSGF